jgi:hypothetical protein
MNYWDSLNLMQLPLSAYTPGQGDAKMEGGFETATGAPVYTFEMWQRGEAPYVTGATSQKNPTGAMVYRTLGDLRVPVKITDYGPGVKGIDIASSNSKWANNFPYQGATEQFSGTPPLLARPGDQMDNPRPMLASAPGGAQMSSWADYANALQPSATDKAVSGLGSALSRLGGGMQQQGQQQGMQQALALLSQGSPAAGALQQYAANPLQFLINPYLRG